MSLIYSRPAGDRPLTMSEVHVLAPAAFATCQADHLSGIYGQVSTYDAIVALADHGFMPVQAAQKKSRTTNPLHGEHLIAFAQQDSNAVEIDGHRGEIILYNSHDGSSSLKLFSGSYRFICSNGIVAGDGFEARIRHTKATIEGIEDLIRDTANNLPALMQRIQKYEKIELDQGQVLEFAKNAASLRWEWLGDVESTDDLKGSFADQNTVQGLLQTFRREDAGNSAWNVYNRCQEKLVRGGPRIASFTDRTGLQGRYRRSRAINSVKATTDFNRNLWNILEDATEAA